MRFADKKNEIKKDGAKKTSRLGMPKEGYKRQSIVLPEEMITKIWGVSKSDGKTFSKYIEEIIEKDFSRLERSINLFKLAEKE